MLSPWPCGRYTLALVDTSHIEEFFDHLDRTADFLTRRGLVAVLFTHHLRAATFLPELYEATGSLYAEIALLPNGLRVGYEINRQGQLRFSLILDRSFAALPAALLASLAIVAVVRLASQAGLSTQTTVLLSLGSFLVVLFLASVVLRRMFGQKTRRPTLPLTLSPRFLTRAVYAGAIATVVTSVFVQFYSFLAGFVRAISDTVVRRLWSSVRTVPWALAVLIVLFSTADAWRLFGRQTAPRFLIFAGLLGILGVVAIMVKSRDENRDWLQILGRELGVQDPTRRLSEWASATPAVSLAAQVRPDVSEPHWLTRWNFYALYFLSVAATVVATWLTITAAFLAIGVVAASKEVTSEFLSNTAITPVLTLTAFDQEFVLTAPLFWLSSALGVIAALTFATTAVQEPGSWRSFLDGVLLDLRRTAAAYTYYRAGMAELPHMLAAARAEAAKAVPPAAASPPQPQQTGTPTI